MDLEDFGRAVRRHRERLGMSLADVGQGAGCSRQNVHKLEKAIGNPTVGTLQRVAQALGLELRLELEEADPARADLSRRLRRIFVLTPDDRLAALERSVQQLEADYLPASIQDEERRVRALASLLEMAGVSPERASARARGEEPKPDSWDDHRERLVAIIQEELSRS